VLNILVTKEGSRLGILFGTPAYYELSGEGHQLLGVIAPLLSIHEQICKQQSKFDDEVRQLARSDETTRRLMTRHDNSDHCDRRRDVRWPVLVGRR